MDYITKQRHIEAIFTEIDLLQISREKIAAIRNVMAPQIFSSMVEHAWEILHCQTRFLICFCNCDAPDPRTACDIEYVETATLFAGTNRVSYAFSRLCIHYVKSTDQNRKELFCFGLMFDLEWRMSGADHFYKVAPG